MKVVAGNEEDQNEARNQRTQKAKGPRRHFADAQLDHGEHAAGQQPRHDAASVADGIGLSGDVPLFRCRFGGRPNL
jgi:hypothetical protein